MEEETDGIFPGKEPAAYRKDINKGDKLDHMMNETKTVFKHFGKSNLWNCNRAIFVV